MHETVDIYRSKACNSKIFFMKVISDVGGSDLCTFIDIITQCKTIPILSLQNICISRDELARQLGLSGLRATYCVCGKRVFHTSHDMYTL